jgi:hypothetical protein
MILGISMRNALKKAPESGHAVISNFLNAGVRKIQKIETTPSALGIQDCDYWNRNYDYRNTGL